jgi:hypothetical protein
MLQASDNTLIKSHWVHCTPQVPFIALTSNEIKPFHMWGTPDPRQGTNFTLICRLL